MKLREINNQLQHQMSITEKFPKHSQEYRDSLTQEIELLEIKRTF